MDEGPAQEVKKIEGRSTLPRRLEDPTFRKTWIANRPVPEGRDVWKDNERLDIRLPEDPLEYTWPSGRDFSSYDPVLKRNWEDEMFELKWFGKSSGQVQGGDWANFRVSREVPPRIKIYYANIVSRFQEGSLLAATKVFNALMADYLAPRAWIPYGVFHTMLLIYKQRGRYERAFEMFNQIVSYHTPTPDDYALGMEVLLALNTPRDALEVWDSFCLRPSLKPNANMYSMLLRTYAQLGDDANVSRIFVAAEKEAKARAIPANSTALPSTVNPPLDFLPIYTSMIAIYAERGYAVELQKLIEPITQKYPFTTMLSALEAYNSLGLYETTIEKWNSWLSPHKSSITDIRYINPLLEAHIKTGNVAGINQIAAEMTERNMNPDLGTYKILIENRFNLGDNSKLANIVTDGLNLKSVRPSIRNYRLVRTANVTAHAKSSSASPDDAASIARTTLDDLQSKNIEIDADMFQALMLCYVKNADLASAVKLWRSEIIERNLIPHRSSFSQFFTVAGMNSDPINVALIWKLAQTLHITPDHSFASALSLGLQPDRNYFGRSDTRALHRKWTTIETDPATGCSLGPRVLNKSESDGFTKFIDHILSTFSEADKKKIDKEWKSMYAAFTEPVAEPVVQDNTPVARPSDPTPTIRRIFAKERQGVPRPHEEHPDEAHFGNSTARHPVSEVTPEEPIEVAEESVASAVPKEEKTE